ncbi:MAG: spore photoproduct lyase family protein [Candidatus Omnitrophota bacterium]
MQPLAELEEITLYVHREFPGFGLNKTNSAIRLLYEISRKDGADFSRIIPDRLRLSRDFSQIKDFLLAVRYPTLNNEERMSIPPVTPLKFCHDEIVNHGNQPRALRRVFFEKKIASSAFLAQLKSKLPDTPFEEISSYKDYVAKHAFSIPDYNKRAETLFVIEENYDFFLHCPCTNLARPCGYYILNAGMGCVYDCAYCYLQGYTNSPGLMVPANLDDILENFRGYYRDGIRVGTGQFTDSLAMDDLTGFSLRIIEFFRKFPGAYFEFKTKSACVGNLVNTMPAANILVSWSVNPQHMIDAHEGLTASLDERLSAAQKCVDAGYYTGFHFDPIVFYHGWEKDYELVVKKIFERVPSERIRWISLGCLRMSMGVKQVMEKRFPDSSLLDAETVLGFDKKVRYPERIRRDIYKRMLEMIADYSRGDVFTYLCMEDEDMNANLAIPHWSSH